MSVTVMAWVWKHSPYTGAKLVLHLALADFADDDGRCFPSHVTLAKKARCSERWVYGVIDQMKHDGFLEVLRHGGRNGSTNMSNQYRLRRPGGMNSVQGQVEVDPEIEREMTLNPGSGEPSVSQPSKTKARQQKPLHPDAERIARSWWDSESPKPATGFVASRRVVSDLLVAGWDETRLLAALKASPTCTVRAVEIELKRGRHPTRAGPAAQSYAAAQRFLNGGENGQAASNGTGAVDAGELGSRPDGRGDVRSVERPST